MGRRKKKTEVWASWMKKQAEVWELQKQNWKKQEEQLELQKENAKADKKNSELDQKIQKANLLMVSGSILFLAFISALSIKPPDHWEYPPIAYVLYGMFPLACIMMFQGFRYLLDVEVSPQSYSPFIQKEGLNKIRLAAKLFLIIAALLIVIVVVYAILTPTFSVKPVIFTIFVVTIGIFLLAILYLMILWLIDRLFEAFSKSKEIRISDKGTLFEYIMAALAFLLLIPIGYLIRLDWTQWNVTLDLNFEPHNLALWGLFFAFFIVIISVIKSKEHIS